MSQQINLFNPILLKQKKILTSLAMLQALGVVLAGALALAYYGKSQVTLLEKKAAESKAQLTLKQARQEKVNVEFAPRQRSNVIEADIVKAEAELKALRDVFAVLQRGEFGNTEGYAEYFRAFARQSVSGLWLTGISINGAGKDISVRGRALQPAMVPAYISRLRSESSLRGKSFATLVIEQQLVSGPVDKAAIVDKAAVAPFVEFNLQSNPSEGMDAPRAASK